MKTFFIQNTEVSYLGPSLDVGPLPAVFYFALSSHDSLQVDPYNQPALIFGSNHARVFSINLPEHEEGKSAQQAIGAWVEHLLNQRDILTPFFEKCSTIILDLIDQKIINPDQFGLMGLSRGAFTACQVAARLPFPTTIVGFSPLVRFSNVREAHGHSHHLQHLDLFSIIPKLSSSTLQFFIGNHDTRVSTLSCAEFITQLADHAFEKGIKSPPIELKIFPSIGYMGHGTPKPIFEKGAAWMMQQLRLK